jgi:hypothetical protein
MLYEDNIGGAALPAWVSFTTSGTAAQTVTFSPTYAEIGTHEIIAIFTPDHGSAARYTAMRLTVECTITAFTKPSNPADFTYNVWDPMLPIQMQGAGGIYYPIQAPACNYPLTLSYTYTGTSAYVFENGSANDELDVHAIKGAAAATYPITVAVAVVVPNGNNSGTTSFSVSGTVDFNVIVTNPCLAANGMTIDPIVFTDAAPTVVDGTVSYTEWPAPATSVDTALSTTAVCGATSYAVYMSSNGDDIAPSAWATLSEPVFGTYRLTFDTNQDLNVIDNEASVTKTLYIKTTLDLWAQSEYDAITININAAVCDCQWLLWSAPTPNIRVVAIGSSQTYSLPTPTPDSLTNQSVKPTFQKCYFNGGTCTENGQFAAASDLVLDGTPLTGGLWLTFTPVGYNQDYFSSSQQITVDPTYADIGTHTLATTWTSVNGLAATYTAIQFTIECTVASFTKPSVSDTAYTVYYPTVTVSMEDQVYV